MNSMTLLIPAFIAYIGLVYWLLTRFKIKEIWRANGSAAVETNTRLTGVVKRILDFFMAVYLIVLIMLLPVAVVMAISQNSNPTWGIDIVAFASFYIDINLLDGVDVTGLRHPEISGKTSINIDTSNLFAWYLFMFSQGIAALTGLYGVIQLRAIVISLRSGLSFNPENSKRIKKLGLVIIAWSLFNPFLQYFGWGKVIQEISFSSSAIQLTPAFQLNAGALFIGIMMLLLSGVLQEAAVISKEQELTI